MSILHTIEWKDIYSSWQAAISSLPVLCGSLRYRHVAVTDPKYGQIYHYDWVKKEEEERAVQAGIAALASGWPEVGMNWSKGTLHTAALLAGCETEEDIAAVWICAFALSLLRKESAKGKTRENLRVVERSICAIVARNHNYWHSSSRDFFPELYVPSALLWEEVNLSVNVLVELAAINAALVMAHYTPVEYKKEC